MAARENQGLQIALIIFVGLTILLCGTSYWLFDQFKNEHTKSLADVAARKKADADLIKKTDELDRVKRLMGFAPKDEVAAVEAEFKKDMAQFGKTFPEPNQQYRFIVADLDKQLKKKNEQIIDREEQVKELEAKVKKDDSVKTTELASYQQQLDKNKQDSAKERETFNSDRDKKNKEGTQIAAKLAEKNKEMDGSVKKLQEEIEDLAVRLRKESEKSKTIVEREQGRIVESAQVDGKITWVNQRGRVVWLNLGADDGLRRQVSFAVLGADESNPLKADKKGSVEVTRVLDRHLAEARIIDDSPSKPIMPGDSIFSAAFQPGRPEHFALAGLIDIDHDGLSDRDRVRDLITLNGGIIDAEVKDDGSLVGELTVETRYLVLGDRPGDKNTNNELLKNYSELIGAAKGLPIKQISVPELLDYLGYENRERTVPLGADAKPEDFRPRAPEGVQRKSSNNMFKSRRNTTQSTDKSKSAY